MLHRALKVISVLIILSMVCHQIGWAHPGTQFARAPESHACKGVNEWLSVRDSAPRLNSEEKVATAVKPWGFTLRPVAFQERQAEDDSSPFSILTLLRPALSIGAVVAANSAAWVYFDNPLLNSAITFVSFLAAYYFIPEVTDLVEDISNWAGGDGAGIDVKRLERERRVMIRRKEEQASMKGKDHTTEESTKVKTEKALEKKARGKPEVVGAPRGPKGRMAHILSRQIKHGGFSDCVIKGLTGVVVKARDEKRSTGDVLVAYSSFMHHMENQRVNVTILGLLRRIERSLRDVVKLTEEEKQTEILQTQI